MGTQLARALESWQSRWFSREPYGAVPLCVGRVNLLLYVAAHTQFRNTLYDASASATPLQKDYLVQLEREPVHVEHLRCANLVGRIHTTILFGVAMTVLSIRCTVLDRSPRSC